MWSSTAGCIVMLTLSLLTAPLTARAQSPAKMPRIGCLSLGSGPGQVLEAFQQGLRDLGWIEGQTIAIEYRWAAGHVDRLPALAAELVRLRVDLIVAAASPAIQAAKDATTSIPIVMLGAADPVASRFVASLARPGGNITGISNIQPELAGMQVQLVLIGSVEELDSAFAAMRSERAEALLVQPLLIGALQQGQRIADLAVQHHLPTIASGFQFAEQGGLLYFGPDILTFYRHSAVFVDKILKGAKPGDLPVEQPTKFELVINLKTAQALDLTIPPILLFQADKVIQ